MSSPGGRRTFDLGDFFERLIRGSRWTGRFGDELGHGPLLAIPVNWESYNLAYLPEILARAGVDVPRTWPEYFAAAKTIAAHVPGAPGFRPARRGGLAHRLYRLRHPAVVLRRTRLRPRRVLCHRLRAAASTWPRTLSDAIRVAGPADWTSQGWYELAMDFARGEYGLLVDSDHYVAYFENPSLSDVAGKVRYALPPPARRHQAPEHVDVVAGHERPLGRAGCSLGVHGVGDQLTVPDRRGAGRET